MVSAKTLHERTKHDPATLGGGARRDPETLPRPFKRYDGVRSQALCCVVASNTPALPVIAESAPDPLRGTEQTTRDVVDRRTIASLCHDAAGIKGEDAHPGAVDRRLYYRMASCTGNLHHVDAYLVTGDVPGLDAGVYHFDPETFSLDVLRTGDHRGVLAEAVGELDTPEGPGSDGSAGRGVAADAPVSVVCTSTWWRNAWKYRDRTYRHAFWDTGTVLANLLATAHGRDLPASVAVGFDDDTVAELLDVDPATEAPIAVVPVGRDAPVPDARALEAVDATRVPQPPHERTHDLPHRAWRSSALDDGAAAAEWRRTVRAAVPVGRARTSSDGGDPGDAGDGGDDARPGPGSVVLDPVDHETATARPLSNTLRRRRSIRSFSDDPLSRRKVATVLDRATRGIPLACRPDDEAGLCCTNLFVLATNVDGVPDGTYRYRPGDGTLDAVGPVTSRDQTHLALNQEWAGDAHVNVFCTTDVDAVVDALGDRGYRLAQLEAGIVLGRLYLATYAHRSLGGTGLTFFDDAVSEHLAPQAEGQSPMTLYAIGVRS